MAMLLEKPLSTMQRSFIPGRLAMLSSFRVSSYTKWSYISSLSTSRSCSFASSAMAVSVSCRITPPVGLLGETTTSILVLSVILERSCWISA